MIPTTSIYIPAGTIVGRITLDRVTPFTLVGNVYVEASRVSDGTWVYSVGGHSYCCAGGLATVL